MVYFQEVNIGNSIISSAIWKNHARVSFSKNLKHESKGRVLFVVFEKYTSARLFRFQIMLLLINNVHENILGNVFTVFAVLHHSSQLWWFKSAFVLLL